MLFSASALRLRRPALLLSRLLEPVRAFAATVCANDDILASLCRLARLRDCQVDPFRRRANCLQYSDGEE